MDTTELPVDYKLVYAEKSTTLVDGWRPSKTTMKELQGVDQQLAIRYAKLETMERSLALRIQSFGLNDREVWDSWAKLVGEYNVVGMRFLQKGRLQDCGELLKRAMNLLHSKLGDRETRLRLLAITYNNLSCHYKRKGLMKMALQHAEKAREIEEVAPEVDNPATTLLNLCAILSRLGRHREALAHAHKALQVCEAGPTLQQNQEEVQPASDTAIDGEGIDDGTGPADAGAETTAEPDAENREEEAEEAPEGEQPEGEQPAESTEPATVPQPAPARVAPSEDGKSSVLAICYHNMAIELEHLKELEKARECHAQAVKVAEREAGKDHPTYKKFKSSLVRVDKKLREQQKNKMMFLSADLLNMSPTRRRPGKAGGYH
jgi:tetratricopeptide (TPR) repeat protein